MRAADGGYAPRYFEHFRGLKLVPAKERYLVPPQAGNAHRWAVLSNDNIVSNNKNPFTIRGRWSKASMKRNVSIPQNEQQIDFVQTVLEAAEKRRDAVENKASIMLASNAILLTAMASLNLEILFASSISWPWYELGLIIICLGSIAASSLFALMVLAVTPQKVRKNMNTPSSGSNLYHFERIAAFNDAKKYDKAIQSLSENQIIEQLTSQTYNLSLILNYRYKWYQRSHGAFIFGIFAFILLVIVVILG